MVEGISVNRRGERETARSMEDEEVFGSFLRKEQSQKIAEED
jgi:hypothetical protein